LTIRKLSEVGRYAIGVVFSDGHDSILPYRELRAHCPCEACAAKPSPPTAAPPPAVQVADLQRIGDTTLFLRWADGHETLLVAGELRGLCRCAHCIGEPNYPISRQ
jgi:DUF971 family protein